MGHGFCCLRVSTARLGVGTMARDIAGTLWSTCPWVPRRLVCCRNSVAVWSFRSKISWVVKPCLGLPVGTVKFIWRGTPRRGFRRGACWVLWPCLLASYHRRMPRAVKLCHQPIITSPLHRCKTHIVTNNVRLVFDHHHNQFVNISYWGCSWCWADWNIYFLLRPDTACN